MLAADFVVGVSLSLYAKPTGNGGLMGAGPLQIQPAGEKGDALAIGGSSAKLLKTRTDIIIL